MLGDTPEQAAGALAEVRKRDASRLAQQMAGSDSLSGHDLTLVGPNARAFLALCVTDVRRGGCAFMARPPRCQPP